MPSNSAMAGSCPILGAVDHLRVLRPAEGVLAFYDGRVPGYRYAEERNWVDEGAIELGIASFAIADGAEALIYDTHVSVEHARFIRSTLEAEGAERFTVLLSHNHLDHVAGTEAFADCEVIATERTSEILERDRAAIESGRLSGPPAIDPLVLPTRTFAERMDFRVGAIGMEFLHFDIHSDDAAVIRIPDRRLLLAGDTLEDTVTYVDEPGSLGRHLEELERLAALGAERILPNHGDPDVIASGGYPPGLIGATEDYIRKLLRCPAEPELAKRPLIDFVGASIDAGSVRYFEPYEAVHRQNVEAVVNHGGEAG